MESIKKFLKTVNITSYKGIRNLFLVIAVVAAVIKLLLGGSIYGVVEWWFGIFVSFLLVTGLFYLWILLVGRKEVVETINEFEDDAKKFAYNTEEKLKDTAEAVSEKTEEWIEKADDRLHEDEETEPEKEKKDK